MKILFINTYDQKGGAAQAAYRLHSDMKNVGVKSLMLVKNKTLNDFSVLATSSYDKRPKYFSDLTDLLITKIKNKIQHFNWRLYPNRTSMILSDLRFISIHGALKKTEFDILHLHWINHRFFNIAELLKVNKPIVWTLHDAWPFTGICHIANDCNKYEQQCGNCPQLKAGIIDDLSHDIWLKKQKIYKSLDLHIVSPSHWLASCVRKSTLLKSFPVTVIPNGINTEVFSPVDKSISRENLNLKLNKKYILFGAMQALSDTNKGFEIIRKTLISLKEFYSYNELELLIVGAEEPIEKIDLYYNQHYLGILTSENKMAQVYNAADVAIVPSFSENLSNTIMENLSCGIPVVAFNMGGNGDMIDHQINGYLAVAFSSEDLANGLVWCLNTQNSKSLSENARKKVIENFSQNKISEQYKKLYTQISHA